MKKYFAGLMIMATLAFMVPFEAFAQTYTYRRVYRNGRWQTVRVYTQTNRGNHYGWRNSNRGNRYGWRNQGISPRERARIARQNMRLYNMRNRITRDGRVTRREAQRWDRSTDRYRRSIRRARNY